MVLLNQLFFILLIRLSRVAAQNRELTYSELITQLESYNYEDLVGDIMKAITPESVTDNNVPSTEGPAAAPASVNISAAVKGNEKKSQEKTHYDVDVERESGSVDDATKVIGGAAAIGGNIGKTVEEKNSFRKGSKSLGYHKVLRKDEYKNDKIFYDENEKSGKVDDKKEGALAILAGAGGKFMKGKIQHDFTKAAAGKEGSLDNISFDKAIEGFAVANGLENLLRKSNDKSTS